MTATQLLETLRSCGVRVTVDGTVLKCRSTISEGLHAPLRILHTGVRAIITGRQWLGLKGTGHSVKLSTDQLIPAEMTYLCCLGDGSVGGQWQKIPLSGRRACESLFGGSQPMPSKPVHHDDPEDAEDVTAVRPNADVEEAGLEPMRTVADALRIYATTGTLPLLPESVSAGERKGYGQTFLR